MREGGFAHRKYEWRVDRVEQRKRQRERKKERDRERERERERERKKVIDRERDALWNHFPT